MSQLPMKVSEAVAYLKTFDTPAYVTDEDVEAVQTLLASHEALRLAGESVSQEPYNQSAIAGLGTIVVNREQYDALSLAVEDASK